MKPTKDTYKELDRAYQFFNKTLFAGKLPNCIVTMQRKKNTYGYFWGSAWTDASGRVVTDEIALNPDHFRGRSTAESLSTLVHEMCHLQQHHFGRPSRNGYHNKEWVQMMEAVGLVPSDTGRAGGKKTGQKVSHYIDYDGAFAKGCEELIADGFTIPWLAITGGDDTARKKKAASKTKYTCPECGTNAWAKPDTALICGECNEAMTSELIALEIAA